MRMKDLVLRQLVIGISAVLLLSTLTSAISVRSQDKKSKSKSDDKVQFHDDSSSEKVLERQGLYSDDDDQLGIDSTLDSRELLKKAQNLTESKPAGKRKKEKEHSPASIDVIPPAELDVDDNLDDEGESLSKADLNRESRGDKNIRIYYDDAVPRFVPSHPHSESPFEHSLPEAKSKDGKLYFPKNYLNSKHSAGPKKGHRPSLLGLSGKRIPDHVHFDEGGHPTHEYTPGHGHSHQHPVIGHHEEHEIGQVDDTPYTHGIEDDHGSKGHHHHVSGYGYNNNHHQHYGSYRHTIGDKVDVFGKALQVLLPSALLITGVSALFPNRVHVPTTPNKYRQKRSVYRRRVGMVRGMVPPPLLAGPAHIPPELEDIPSHILHAEHRIMDGNPAEMYPEYGKRYGSINSAESTGFNPFKVFKGPGPENEMIKIQNAMPFPNLPELTAYNVQMQVPPSSGEFRPEVLEAEPVPPTESAPVQIIPQPSPPTANLDALGQDAEFMKQRQNLPLRRRKPIRKSPVFLKEAHKVQQSSESQKSQYLVKNTLDDSNSKLLSQIKAEREFMSSLQNLVTPDVAKAIVEHKQEAPKQDAEVDLSPDGPVMGLLTSYAQHENDTPACQKRALCELAVKGKDPKSTKFEAFLWSVATLVPDVFSEMYDLQEVFKSIREERCNNFECTNPNLDIQM